MKEPKMETAAKHQCDCPQCNCEEKGIGKPKWYAGCPVHRMTNEDPRRVDTTCASCGTHYLDTCPSCDNPREPREDDSLAQESVDEEASLLSDLTYLLGNEGDARIVEAYLIGVYRGDAEAG